MLRQHAFLWWLLHRFCSFAGFNVIGKFGLTYLVDVIGLTEAQARATQGKIVVLISLSVLLASVPAGMLSDRFGRRRLIFAAGLIAGVATFLISQTTSLTIAVGLLVVTGAGSAVFYSVGWALVAGLVPVRQAAFYLGVTNIATSLGSAAGLIGGFVVDEVNRRTDSTYGYKVVLILAATSFLISALAVQRIREARSREPGSAPSWRNISPPPARRVRALLRGATRRFSG
jgi:MFS family permease